MSHLRFLILVLAAALVSACVTSGPAAKDAGSNPELAPAQLDRIKEIREKQKAGPRLDPNVSTNLEASRHMTAQEYVQGPGANLQSAEYAVGGQDVLTILVYEEKELSREAVAVSTDGTLTFPFIGRLKVGGMTTAQIEELIARELTSKGFLINPHVSVMVKEYKSKNVVALGSIKTPGRYPLQGQETLLDILSKAGGVDFATGGSRATVMRTMHSPDGQKSRVAIDVNIKRLFDGEDQHANLLVQSEDVIYVPMAEKVYIMGEVTKPGEYVIEDRDVTVVEAIGMAGGFTRIAAPNRTTIIRMENGQERILQVRVDDITGKGQKGSDISLKDKDIVVVPESYF